jgi:hypothetical protein
MKMTLNDIAVRVVREFNQTRDAMQQCSVSYYDDRIEFFSFDQGSTFECMTALITFFCNNIPGMQFALMPVVKNGTTIWPEGDLWVCGAYIGNLYWRLSMDATFEISL